jgi:DNA-binding response OmpR family regulator
LRVLVADDEPSAAQALAAILVQEGHHVCVAYDGAEVLWSAQRFRPEVVILDIGMPKLNGYDVARALKKRYLGIVLIAVTGWKQSTDRIFAQAAGFDHHFGKPYKSQAIIELLARLDIAGPSPD